MEEKSIFEKFEMQFDESAKGFLKEAAKWANVLSIIGFVGIGFMGLAAISGFLSSKITTLRVGPLNGITGKDIALIYVILIVVYFFPVYYLNKFAVNVKKAFRENDSSMLTKSFKNLKSHFKYIAVFTISFIVLYVSIIIIVIIIARAKYS
ncbi:hypothetical protein [Flavobacterium ginsenosidimutans]|uniref:hypothetical protein n=1 Tax=Flavobacterium ginsenosidimutans TaxID=687844 RepID=UPI000DABC4C1|nr:hypothetical protein [Flavobacterium ginsenosidimutans]KAF2332824.1 hypothetical protein DM444_08410 [Flavobacterium ginsenosidimutans]